MPTAAQRADRDRDRARTAISGSRKWAATRSAGSPPAASSRNLPCPRPQRAFGITVGPDDNLWFTEMSGNKIGRITTGGRRHRVPHPRPAASLMGSPRVRTATSGSRKTGNKIGADHHRRNHHRVRRPHGHSQPRDHVGSGRQHLVHRNERQQDRPAGVTSPPTSPPPPTAVGNGHQLRRIAAAARVAAVRCRYRPFPRPTMVRRSALSWRRRMPRPR